MPTIHSWPADFDPKDGDILEWEGHGRFRVMIMHLNRRPHVTLVPEVAVAQERRQCDRRAE